VQRKNITGIVGIVAVTDEGKLILVEQYRTPVDKRVIEIPAGLVGDTPGMENEALAEAANRELEEETGYRAQRIEPLAVGTASAGMSDEVITLLRASGLSRVGNGGGDASEQIQVHEISVNQVRTWLTDRQKEGLLVDLKVYSALYFAGEKVAPPAAK
jgi:ADP-ribose pyrophosphatase